MADTVTIVKPETILKWHRKLVARKFDGANPDYARVPPAVPAAAFAAPTRGNGKGHDGPRARDPPDDCPYYREQL